MGLLSHLHRKLFSDFRKTPFVSSKMLDEASKLPSKNWLFVFVHHVILNPDLRSLRICWLVRIKSLNSTTWICWKLVKHEFVQQLSCTASGSILVCQDVAGLLQTFGFCRPYLRNGQAYGTDVVCRLTSVCRRLSWMWLNGAKWGLDCYWLLIGSRILVFKWHENRWPWMTLKVDNAWWYANHVVLWLNGKS